MKKIFFLFFVIVSLSARAQDIYSSQTAKITFFSTTPIENIDANSSVVAVALNTKTNLIFIKVPIQSFQFKKELMQDHFNEDYMESDKYPDATFNGKVNQTIDYTKNASNNVTMTGKLTIHNTTKDTTIAGTLIVNSGHILLHADFPVKLVDYNITVPKLVFQHIAQVMKVTFDADCVPYVKN
jgi:hypothetical protein